MVIDEQELELGILVRSIASCEVGRCLVSRSNGGQPLDVRQVRAIIYFLERVKCNDYALYGQCGAFSLVASSDPSLVVSGAHACETRIKTVIVVSQFAQVLSERKVLGDAHRDGLKSLAPSASINRPRHHFRWRDCFSDQPGDCRSHAQPSLATTAGLALRAITMHSSDHLVLAAMRPSPRPRTGPSPRLARSCQTPASTERRTM